MTVDVAILGGGLAGLTLAIQLKRRLPALEIVVLERRQHPVPHAIHKVGESSVEIAAEYFANELGLKEHLTQFQLPKFGFRFFFSDGRMDFDAVTELGPSRHLAVPSYQIDRGIFENFLGVHALRLGIGFVDAANVTSVAINGRDQLHRLAYTRNDVAEQVDCRWLVDASGRAQLLKRKLGLQLDNAHDVNAVWFRVGSKIDVNEWSNDEAWLARCQPRSRWLSTNHLVGEGYWVWLIPLASGSHSVGIVADPKIHPLKSINTFERALAWLQTHQPRLAADLQGKRELLQDFAFFRKFSYGAKQVFGSERWAITGEAGVFLDPFYSPGSDFIAISNTYITELISKETAGEHIAPYVKLYEQMYLSFYDSMLPLYLDQYRIFGDPRVLPVKVLWDYTYYWGILCQFFYQRRLADIGVLGGLRAELGNALALNKAIQTLLRSWSLVSSKPNHPVMLDQAQLAWFAALNRSLLDQLDRPALSQRIRANVAQMQALAREILAAARADSANIDASELLHALGDQGSPPSAVPTRLLFTAAITAARPVASSSPPCSTVN